jgi:hypothetical protein
MAADSFRCSRKTGSADFSFIYDLYSKMIEICWPQKTKKN